MSKKENKQDFKNKQNACQQNQGKDTTERCCKSDTRDNAKCCCDKNQGCTNHQCEEQLDTIQNLNAQLDEWKNKYLRAYADAENAKRIAEIDAKNLVDYRISNFAKDMIPLADNLSLAIASIKDSVDENVLMGLKSIEENFINALKKNGITKIETIGKKLNPAEHRVVSQIESDAEQDSVVQEFQAGYKLGDKVIREAMVATAKPKK